MAKITKIGPRNPPRIFLQEHREAHVPQLSQQKMGERFKPPRDKGVISKWESKARRGKLKTEVVAEYAAALGKNTEEMYSLPTPSKPISLDVLAEPLPDAQRAAVIDLIIALGGRKAG